MTKIHFLLLVFLSCAELPYRKIPVNNHAEGRSVVTNQMRFLQDLFQQSFDPYYGTPKWTEECLRENSLGPVEEDSETLRSEALVYLNEDGEPGFCSGDKKALIFLFCKRESFVREYKILPEEAKRVSCN